MKSKFVKVQFAIATVACLLFFVLSTISDFRFDNVMLNTAMFFTVAFLIALCTSALTISFMMVSERLMSFIRREGDK